MKRNILLLTILLIAQIALAAFLLWPRQTATTAAKLIADINLADLNELILTDDKDSIHLKKNGDQWVLPEQGDFPAIEAKITEVMSKALAIDTRQLVASNAGNFAQLKVADNDFVRKVTFSTTGGVSKTLIIGNSPNTKATNVRLAGSNDVYITNQMVGADARLDFGNWVETGYYSTASDEIKGVTIENASGKLEFSKNVSNTWQIAGLTAGETFSDSVWSGIASRLSNLSLSKPLGKEAKPEYGFDKPNATISLLIQPTAGVSDTAAPPPSTVTIQVGAEDTADSSYYVKSSTSDYYVKISNFTMGDFVKKNRAEFVLTPAGALTNTIGFTDTVPSLVTSPITETSTSPITTTETSPATTPVTVTETITPSEVISPAVEAAQPVTDTLMITPTDTTAITTTATISPTQ